MKSYYVYIMSSGKNGTLYTGITSDLQKRVVQHKGAELNGFTSKYNVNKLVYFETFPDPLNAIIREKRIKKWNRKWKINLIQEKNIDWKDLAGFLEENQIRGKSGFPPPRE